MLTILQDRYNYISEFQLICRNHVREHVYVDIRTCMCISYDILELVNITIRC